MTREGHGRRPLRQYLDWVERQKRLIADAQKGQASQALQEQTRRRGLESRGAGARPSDRRDEAQD